VQDNNTAGEENMSGVTLDSVAFDHVIINRGGVRESLYLDQSIPAETVGTDDPGAPAPLATSGNEIAGIASLAPRNEQGRVTGIVISPLGDGSLFKSAGFRDGDIIVSINGNPVGSTSDIEALKSQIRPGARLSVEVERGADTVPVAVNLGAQ
jgi:general secretion pathway protein C